MKNLDVVRDTCWGFTWGPIEVVRIGSNNGDDHKSQYVVIGLRSDKGHMIDIYYTNNGFIVDGYTKVAKE